MSNRETFFRLVRERDSTILSWFMAFFNEKVAKKLLGEENVPGDCIPEGNWDYSSTVGCDRDRKINYAKATGNFAIGVGRGTCIAFGHGGPGEFREKLILGEDGCRISMYETGVKKEIRFNPYFYHHFDHPIANKDDFSRLILPDADESDRYKGITEETSYYKKYDFITYANINGFFSGIHYFIYPYEHLLEDLILDPDFINEIADKIGGFNLKTAENLLKCGVDMITFCDDLGSGNSLLMSPQLYRRFFLPWHKRLADLCHEYGALVHMHSHGDINLILDDLYNAGIDLLNPNDPYEGMDLPTLKQKYGDRITFVGGVDKFFFEWDFREQYNYIHALAKKTGGGFILMDSGGVPENMTFEKFAGIKELFESVK